jgi:hypothetical protein
LKGSPRLSLPMEEEEHAIELAREPRAALAAAARAASDWGAELAPGEAGGRLRMPVTAGLRRGWMEGPLVADPLPGESGGSRLSFRVEKSEYHLQLPAVTFLLLGAAGGLVLLLWPLYPRLLRLAPLGVVLALASWFLVLSRLRVSGPREFLETVAAIAGEEDATTEGTEGDASASPS